jgi:hypothetical protein
MVLIFQETWFESADLLIQSVRRLIRRIYQVVFVALHKVLGLTTELIGDTGRKPISPHFLADQSTELTKKVGREKGEK